MGNSALNDVIQSGVSDAAYDADDWDGVTTIAPSKNALRDKFESFAPVYCDLTPKTSSGSLSAAECAGNVVITNTGAGDAIALTMPAAVADLAIPLVQITVAQYLRFTADGTDKFRYCGTAGAAGGYIRANTVGTSWKMVCTEVGYWDLFHIENPPVLYDA